MPQQINRALVVDDSRLARIALSKLLQKRNVAVEVVGTGGEALDYLRSDRPDVVFMDYMMPDMDGFEATRRLRDIHSDGLPVVMYTSQDTSEDRDRARELGIAGFLSKPSGEHNLDEVLSQLAAMMPAEGAPAPSADTEAASPEPVPAGVDVAEPDPAATAEAAAPDVTEAEADDAVAAGGEASPATAPVPEVRAVAREEAEGVLAERLPGLVEQRLAQLEERVEQAGEGSLEAARSAAQEAARSAAEEAAEAIADRTARRIAESVAQETAERVSQDVGPGAAKQIMNDLRRDVRNYVSELFAADAFREQITEIVRDSGGGGLDESALEAAVPRIRDWVSRDAVQAAERAAAEAARNHGVQAAEEAAGNVVEERMAAMRDAIEARSGESIAALRRLVMILAVVAVGGVAGSVVLTLLLTGAVG